MRIKQKVIAFWRKIGYLRLKAANTKIKIILIPCLLVLLGVLFLLPKVAYLSQKIDGENLIKLTNEQRQHNGLSALAYNETLVKAAENKARDLLKNGYFSHNGLGDRDFSTWIKEAGYNYAYAGENLAMDFITNEGVIAGWMNSGKHRENILGRNYKEIGIAAVSGKFNGKKTVMVVQIFGAQMEEKLAESKKEYLAVNKAFLLPRFLSSNMFDIFIPKTEDRTIAKHNGAKKIAILNSGHLKKYADWKENYWGEVNKNEFTFKKVKITLLGQDNKTLDSYPFLP